MAGPDPGSPGASSDEGLRGRDLIGLGGLLAGTVIAGTVLGLVLDRAAGTSPAFTIAGVFLGMALGAVGFVVRVRAAIR